MNKVSPNIQDTETHRWRRRTFRFFSSVRLAVVLLLVLIVGIAIGTICESRFDAKVARAYVYDAPWFNLWMVLLGANLAAAAFSRYPWKKHHTGFVITHAGIITLLTGALVGRIWGIQGTMTLFTGDEPSNQLVLDQQAIRVEDAGKTTTFLVSLEDQRHSSSKPLALGATPEGLSLAVTDYAERLLPVQIAQPVTDGGEPAVQVRLWSKGQDIKEWLWPRDPGNRQINLGLLAVECRLGEAPMAGSNHASVGNPKSYLQKVSLKPDASNTSIPDLPPGDHAIIYLSNAGKLSLYLQNKDGGKSQGILASGKEIPTGWGRWKMEVSQVMAQAIPDTEFEAVSKTTEVSPNEKANLTKGIKIRFTRDGETDEEWLASGWVVDLPGTKVPVRVTFGPRTYPLPVSLTLKNFEVERNEGLDTPAGFKSTLEVRDTSGASAVGSCSMNEPMNFPDAMWRRWTGLTYKISQASWNPENLHQSSVQILFDPGWLFKWLGSLMVCTGIFTMFYLRPPRGAAHP